MKQSDGYRLRCSYCSTAKRLPSRRWPGGGRRCWSWICRSSSTGWLPSKCVGHPWSVQRICRAFVASVERYSSAVTAMTLHANAPGKRSTVSSLSVLPAGGAARCRRGRGGAITPSQLFISGSAERHANHRHQFVFAPGELPLRAEEFLT